MWILGFFALPTVIVMLSPIAAVLYLKRELIASFLKFYLRERFTKFFDIGYQSNDKTFTVSYYRGPTKYAAIFPKSRKPLTVLKIESIPDQTDVTQRILPYLGPYGNFHNVPVDPEWFGLDGIKVIYATHQVIFSRPSITN
jgi:hypothetical protein